MLVGDAPFACPAPHISWGLQDLLQMSKHLYLQLCTFSLWEPAESRQDGHWDTASFAQSCSLVPGGTRDPNTQSAESQKYNSTFCCIWGRRECLPGTGVCFRWLPHRNAYRCWESHKWCIRPYNHIMSPFSSCFLAMAGSLNRYQ